MDKRIKTIALTVTEKCNLNCVYCYEHNKDYSVLSLDTAKNAIKKHFSNLKNYDEVAISFHGGEPFIEYNFIKTICEWMWAQEWEKSYYMFATTNGTLLDDSIKKWLTENKNRFIVGLSLDGTREMHNANRSGSYDKIDLSFFLKTWPNQGVKMTVSPITLDRLADGVIELHNKGFMVNCNLALGENWGGNEIQECYSAQLKILADFYIANPNIKPCSLMTMNMPVIAQSEKLKKYKWCGTGEHMVAISPIGKEYPCHSFMPSVNDQDDKSEEVWNLLANSDFCSEKCNSCLIRQQCQTCYGINYSTQGSIEKRPDDYCKLNKIRALANAYMYGIMISNGIDYPHILIKNKPLIASGVMKVQKELCLQ